MEMLTLQGGSLRVIVNGQDLGYFWIIPRCLNVMLQDRSRRLMYVYAITDGDGEPPASNTGAKPIR